MIRSLPFLRLPQLPPNLSLDQWVIRRCRSLLGGFLLALFLAGPVSPANGQAARFAVNSETLISDVDIRFDSTSTFSKARLINEMATRGPGFGDRLRKWTPFLKPHEYQLVPEEVQRDVIRLRRFYAENGFPDAQITYTRSRFDKRDNDIDLVFDILEGDPVRVDSVLFERPDGSPFILGAPRDAQLRDQITLKTGERYSLTEQGRSHELLLSWLKNRGFAFAVIDDSVSLDTQAHTARLHYHFSEGPVAFVDSLLVEGNTRVNEEIITREIPLKPGQRFSQRRLSDGQRELFSLGLFRTVLTDVPDQTADTTVTVRIRLREGRPRLVSYVAGYGRQDGVSLQSDWTHRNFLGKAHTVTAGGIARTGYKAITTDRVAPRLFRASVSQRWPFWISTRLSYGATFFLQFQRDPELGVSTAPLGINEREAGTEATLVYEFIPGRSISLQYGWSRALQSFGTTRIASSQVSQRDVFNRASLSLIGMLGRPGDPLRNRSGFVVRPFVEISGRFLASDISYFKMGSEVQISRRLTERFGLALRVQGGRLFPYGGSQDQGDSATENRFDQIRYYLGGSSDLRGWTSQLAGEKIVRLDQVDSDTTFVYEAIGGLAKVSGDLELRMPFPGLGSKWGTAAFIGMGQVSDGAVETKRFRYGTGAGIRYATPVGLLSLDLAYKLNPDDQDLRYARDVYYLGADAPASNGRRWTFHLSIGQAF